MSSKTILSGIKPSGIPTLGNYIGAISHWAELQTKYQTALFMVVDLHAITVPQPPKTLTQQSYLTAAVMLASGIDPNRSIVFLQSHVPAHTELSWLLTTITTMGELNRMTQFKDKIQKLKKAETIGAGLFTYPILMAADILLYDTQVVPVGEDQKQHVELARDIAERFNHHFGKTFIVPEPIMRKDGTRIMDLQDPTKKMSKSDDDKGCILLTDAPEIIRQKIMRAVTDSNTTIKFDPARKGLFNLLTIYKALSRKTDSAIEKHFANKGYGDFKRELANLVVETLAPIQTKIHYYMSHTKELDKIFQAGAKKADKIANITLKRAKHKIGLLV